MSTDLITFEPNKVALIKRTIAKDATDDELELFMHQCRRTGLDPLSRQIYFQKRRTKQGDQMTVLTAIDGYRLIADRTGLYAGNDDPIFDDDITWAKVTVYKIVKGIRCPFTATARWDEYYPGDAQGFMWKKMPHLMLGKCAEALALRKAFPAELSGIYVREEMEQADKPFVDTSVIQEAPQPIQIEKPKSPSIYNHEDSVRQKTLAGVLKAQKVDSELWEEIGRRLHNLPSTELKRIIADVSAEATAQTGL